MRKKISGIYKIINIINNHFYIGSTSDIHRRWLQHKKDLKNNIHHNNHLQNAWNKYGENNFKFIIEKDTLSFSVDELLNEEQKLLNVHFQKEYCYNVSKSANRLDGEYNPFYGKKHSEKTINILRNHPNTKHCGPNNYWFGKHMTNERKLNQSNTMTGRYTGKNNPRFDKNIYIFKNLKTNEFFEGTRYDFSEKYKLNKGEICSVINKKRRSTKYWVLLNTKEDVISLISIKKEQIEKMRNSRLGKYTGNKHPYYNNTIYTFKNIKTNELFTGTQFHFYNNYNLNKGNVCYMIKGKLKSVKSWILLKE